MADSLKERLLKGVAWLDSPWKRAAFTLVLMTAIFAGALATTWALTPPWRHYLIRPLGLTVELPARPVCTVGSPRTGNVAYECHTRRLAVLLAGQQFSEGHGPCPDAAEMVRRAMSAVEKNPEITNLKYQSRPAGTTGPPMLQVAGTLERNGLPARVRGTVWVADRHARQVLVFFSDEKGARDADRILRSLVPETPPGPD